MDPDEGVVSLSLKKLQSRIENRTHKCQTVTERVDRLRVQTSLLSRVNIAMRTVVCYLSQLFSSFLVLTFLDTFIIK